MRRTIDPLIPDSPETGRSLRNKSKDLGYDALRQLHSESGLAGAGRDVAPAWLSVTALAERLNVTRQAASNLLNGHCAQSAEMAIRFEKPFGAAVDALMRIEAAHVLASAGAGR